MRLAAALKIPAGHLVTLREVYEKISKAASLTPELFICWDETLNASATPGHKAGTSKVTFNSGLLRLLDGNADEIAAVMGHEFAHILLNHTARKTSALDIFADQAERYHIRQRRNGTDPSEAYTKALLYFVGQKIAFSRDEEREADDKGFALAVNEAGYGAQGARRFFEKMIYVTGNTGADYLSEHPGLGERAGFSARLEINQEFLNMAADNFRRNQWKQLGKTVQKWTAFVPDSGAAAFYRGMQRLNTQRHAGSITSAFEDAVSNFDGDGLSKLAQENQTEAKLAPLALCVSLYREGRLKETMYCLQRMKEPTALGEFSQIADWNTVLVIGKDVPPETRGTIWGSQSSNGKVFLTNIPSIVEERGLKEVRRWKGLREAMHPPANIETMPESAHPPIDDMLSAARYGTSIEIANAIQSGGDPSKMIDGLFPVGAAIMAGNAETVDTLLRFGADPRARDSFRRTPLEYAVMMHRSDLAELIRTYGGKD